LSRLLRGQITDESIERMRARIGYPNPTIRAGIVTLPWNTVATPDAIRHYAEACGDDNPLYTDPAYGEGTRWMSQIAPPTFEATMGFDRSPTVPDDVRARTRGALRGVQLYHSGNDVRFYRPIQPGDQLDRVFVVSDVVEKASAFGGRSVVVTNDNDYWNQQGEVVVTGEKWFVHVERNEVSDGHKYATEQLASYTDEDLAEIEHLYDDEFVRGPHPLFYEDVATDLPMPVMVKGPLTVTDLINFHMGAGWMGYGNPALKLAYRNRKAMPGFYTRDEFGAWDSLQRIHWQPEHARQVGVLSSYDVGPMRWAWLAHYCTNFGGDDSWLFRLRCEFRRFNYIGDTTWLRARIVAKERRPDVGPCIDLEITGTNQRGQVNIDGFATILLPSRESGPVALPPIPSDPRYERREMG
jgi:acyl dehydratase